MLFRTPNVIPTLNNRGLLVSTPQYLSAAGLPPAPSASWMTPGSNIAPFDITVPLPSVSMARRGTHSQASSNPTPDASVGGRSSRSRTPTPAVESQAASASKTRSVTSPPSQIYSGRVLTPIPGLFTSSGIVQTTGEL